MEIHGYRRCYLSTILTWIAILSSAFVLRLIFHWKPYWLLYFTYRRCPLEAAEKVLLKDKYNQYFVEQVQYILGTPHPSTLIYKGHFHPPDEDEILRCDEIESQKHTKGPTYGSLVSRHSCISKRSRTISNKSNVTTDDDHSDTDEPEGLKRVGGNINVVAVELNQLEAREEEFTHTVRFFDNKKIRYIWDSEDQMFVRLRGYDRNVTFNKLKAMTGGLKKQEQWKLQQVFGENAIKIQVQSYSTILFQEVLGPFYIFQLISCIIWFNEEYQYYAFCIIIMSLLSLISSVIQISRNQKQLRDTVGSGDRVKVCRGGDIYEEVDSNQVVPGDVVVVPTFNSIIQFDSVLINGNVIVNESMLTGESVPVTKTPLPLHNTKNGEIYYDEKEHSKHTLFCGTKVMQTRYYGGAYLKALVIRIGFQTTKGELIRSIMFPKPVDFQFNKQVHKFVGVLACFAFIGFLYSVVLKTKRGVELNVVLISALDIVTIVVPPALPAAMTIGIIYAQSRLKQSTLTEDSITFNEVIPLVENKRVFGRPFGEEVIKSDSKQVEREHHILMDNGDFSPLMVCLASCHSLTIIDQKIIGDPLDLQMFEATGWVMEEPDVDDEEKFDLLAPTVVRPPRRRHRATSDADSGKESLSSGSSSTEDDLNVVSVNANKRCQKDVGILRQLHFSSSLQRMSVITRQFSGKQYVVYTKGAPEKIASLCDPKTIPDDFSEVLHNYARRGLRIIGLAYRPLKVGLSYTRMQRATRQDIEKDLKFLGLMTLGNFLKPETIPVIDTLNKAAIRTVMVTGDNMLTAICIANESGMISSNDKTVLLKVERKVEKSPSLTNESLQIVKREDNKPQASDSLALNIQGIQMQTHNELDPILNSNFPKESPKPKLVWHYVDSEFQQAESRDESGQVCLELYNDSKTHLALTGETWDVILRHYPELLSSICVRGTVFARMAPYQKQQLVEQLQALDYYVGMCGDGANDSGALRAAHAGISLSDNEASAAAPFTSSNANISCVPTLIREGRAALVTAFGILKYMTLYSIVQFLSVLILFTLHTSFTDLQFLYEDLFIITTLVALFGRTRAHPTLDSKAPPSSLLSVSQLTSVGIQIALVIVFQFLALVILWQNDWFEPANGTAAEQELVVTKPTHENLAIFAISSFQCITLAVVFSKGKPYRQSILSNWLLTAAIVLLAALSVTIVITRIEWGLPFISINVENVPTDFRLMLVSLGITHFMASMIGERFIVDNLIFRKSDKLVEIFGMRAKENRLFESIEQRTRSTHWLPITTREPS